MKRCISVRGCGMHRASGLELQRFEPAVQTSRAAIERAGIPAGDPPHTRLISHKRGPCSGPMRSGRPLAADLCIASITSTTLVLTAAPAPTKTSVSPRQISTKVRKLCVAVEPSSCLSGGVFAEVLLPDSSAAENDRSAPSCRRRESVAWPCSDAQPAPFENSSTPCDPKTLAWKSPSRPRLGAVPAPEITSETPPPHLTVAESYAWTRQQAGSAWSLQLGPAAASCTAARQHPAWVGE